jgi:glycosyltransferase involved in cell wall biosynthesis
LTLSYNEQEFIKKNVESVKNQSYGNFEHIIIDDRSTDATHEIICSNLHGKAIFVEHEENKGLNGDLIQNYNEALGMATGDYGILLDGDDYLLPGALRAFANSLTSNISLCFGKCYIASDGKLRCVVPNIKGETDSDRLFKQAFYEDWFYTPATAFSIPLMKKVGGFSGYKAVFHASFLELGLYGKLKFVDKVLGVRTLHSRNVSNKIDLRRAYARTWNDYRTKGLLSHVDSGKLNHCWRKNLVKSDVSNTLKALKQNRVLVAFSGFINVFCDLAVTYTVEVE